jgi:hypothetical protein
LLAIKYRLAIIIISSGVRVDEDDPSELDDKSINMGDARISSSDIVVEEAAVVLAASDDVVNDDSVPICDAAGRGRGTNAKTCDAIKLHKPRKAIERNIMVVLISLMGDFLLNCKIIGI